MTQRVIITDSVDAVCIDMLTQNGIEADVQLKKSPEELKAIAENADGWIIRSGTRITSDLIEASRKLKVIGRAGVGVDNVDLEAATRKGVLVLNAPDGNTISTAEHTCAMLMSVARHIPAARGSMLQGKWDRKSFTGQELNEKTLGVVGLGKIGRAVAERMKAFGMEVIGFDPVLSQEAAEKLGVALVSIEEIWQRADFITFHTPLNDATRGMLNTDTLAQCKKGVRLVNCARGGIIDEQALLQALESGQVAGAALDVYTQEPVGPELQALIQHPNLVSTPHLAASTIEAQEKVAVQVTEQLIYALQGKPVNSPVNALAIKVAAHKEVQPYLKLADKLGQILGQLCDGHLKRISVKCSGEIPHKYLDVLSISAVKGLLSTWKTGPVNLVNAPFLAKEFGLDIQELRDTEQGHYTNQIKLHLETDSDEHIVAGTIFGDDEVRVVQVDQFELEVRPEGHVLFYYNVDRPGMLASVGSLLAESNINIGALSLGRTGKGALALTAVSVDEAIPAEVQQRIREMEGVEDVRVVNL